MLTVKEVLDKFSECNKFSLTTGVPNDSKIITEEEYVEAVDNLKKLYKERLLKYYNESNINNPSFETLYNDIEEECYNYIKNNKPIDLEICKTTKYGQDNYYFYYRFYFDITFRIRCEMNKEKYLFSDKSLVLDSLPKVLKDNCVSYEVSHYNNVTICELLLVNYYFKLNEETKKYLLKYHDIYDFDELDDLALYKDDEVLFTSCTHEQFNSLDKD